MMLLGSWPIWPRAPPQQTARPKGPLTVMAKKPTKHPQKAKDAGNQTNASNQPTAPILSAELQIPRAVIDEYYSRQKAKQRKEDWRFVIQIGTFIVAMLALGLSGFQGYLTRMVSLAAQQSFRLDQRAWLTIHSVVLPTFREGQSLFIDIHITNAGKTPANNVRFKRNFLTRAPRPEDSANQVEGDNVGPILAPGEQRTQRFTTQPGLTAEQIQALMEGRAVFSLIGTFSYRDIFEPTERHTPLCVVFDRRALPGMSTCGIGVPMD